MEEKEVDYEYSDYTRYMDPIGAAVIYGEDIYNHLHEIHPKDHSLAIATAFAKV